MCKITMHVRLKYHIYAKGVYFIDELPYHAHILDIMDMDMDMDMGTDIGMDMDMDM